jgi:hypothetical protein
MKTGKVIGIFITQKKGDPIPPLAGACLAGANRRRSLFRLPAQSKLIETGVRSHWKWRLKPCGMVKLYLRINQRLATEGISRTILQVTIFSR